MIKVIDSFTSTGVKFWKHESQMVNYKKGNGNTIISTHISPTGSCNLNCSYCSVKKRKVQNIIEIEVIKDYIEKLITRGLKAVIITGGGEPTLYKYFNELVDWISSKQIKLALITNGTLTDRVENWEPFSWIRVSINKFDGWKDKINLPVNKINKQTTIGCSYINTGDLEKDIYDIKFLADRLKAQYVRVLPNCLLNQNDLLQEHKKIDDIFEKYSVKDLFFHQFKVHENPSTEICHQSYFRPYLSEVDGGTVYPCDSVVLNDCVEMFDDKYKICKSSEVLDYLDGKIIPKFNPCKDCNGCVFTNNIKMLDGWKNNRINLFEKYKDQQFKYEEFV